MNESLKPMVFHVIKGGFDEDDTSTRLVLSYTDDRLHFDYLQQEEDLNNKIVFEIPAEHIPYLKSIIDMIYAEQMENQND